MITVADMLNLFREFDFYLIHIDVHRKGGCCCLEKGFASPCCPQHTLKEAKT